MRGDKVFVRQDLLFGPSSSIYSTRRKEFIIRHQELMVSKALDACSGTEVPFDQESHDDFMDDVRERRASLEQARRNAAFSAEQEDVLKLSAKMIDLASPSTDRKSASPSFNNSLNIVCHLGL